MSHQRRRMKRVLNRGRAYETEMKKVGSCSCILQISEFHAEFLQKPSVYVRAWRCEGSLV